MTVYSLINKIEATHKLFIRVYIEDTDAGGIVFYANYLKFFERARTEYFRARGFELRRGLDDNINYVVHSLTIQYKKPARLDDKIAVTAEVIKVGKTYLLFKQRVLNARNEVLVEADVKIACLYFNTSKPQRLPSALLASL